jgi:GTP-binding protein Era
VKSAIVALVGRPSSGKSTLLNRLCGGKVSIVSSVPQTTRNTIRGILTEERGQLVFVDTPGFHLSEKKLNRRLVSLVSSSIADSDSILYVVDGTRGFGEEETALLGLVGKASKTVAIALNKKDAGGEVWEDQRRRLESGLPAFPLFEISALTGEGVDGLLQAVFSAAPEGEMLYPDEFYTDQEPDFRISEIVREKAINLTSQEVPHSLYVKMEDLEFRDEGKTLWARGFIFVERESQKGILIGRAGEKIKRIVAEAESDLALIFPYRVRLDIRAKVSKDWRGNDALLRKLIR